MSNNILRKQHVAQSSSNPKKFIFSDSSIDSYDDQIDQNGWDLYDFNRNPMCLFGHNPDFPLGLWDNVRVENGQLVGDLKLAPAGTSQRIDEIRKLVEAGILRACSVGFQPVESVARPGSTRGGRLYLKQRLIEVSIVSTPANSNALMMEAKALGISDATIQRLLRPSKDASLVERQAFARATMARAREVLAKSYAREANEKAAAKRKLDVKVQKHIDAAKARLNIERETARIVREERDSYAIPEQYKPSWPGDTSEPALYTLDGRPLYRKKNKYGW